MNWYTRGEKIRFMNRMIQQGWTDKMIKRHIDVPRRTYYFWKNRIKEQGCDELIRNDKPGPNTVEFVIDPRTRGMILRWRRKYGWGPTRIEGHLDKHYRIHIPHNRIYQLLVERNMNEAIEKPRKTWGKKRWERKHSMSLLQADWKDVLVGPEPMLTFIDDHSRFILGSNRFPEATTENSIRLLESVCRKYGYPEQVLTDNGTQFVNSKNDNPSTFTQFCTDNGIQHIRTSKGRPTTTGKIEAFHGCYEREAWRFRTHHAYIKYWNHERPHGSLGYLYPVEVFYRDMRGATNSG